MAAKLRVTEALQRVVLLLFQDPSRRFYGLEIAREAGLQRGTLYPILARLEDAGWVTGEWETIDPTVEGRPPRRYYMLTDDGLCQATEIHDALVARLRFQPGLAGP